jgi:DNA-binding IclR family transcriptional regulator
MLVRHPVINAQLLASELSIPGSNVYRYIEPLERAGVLVELTNRRRNRLWRAPEVLAALDAFAARAGRRSVPRASSR